MSGAATVLIASVPAAITGLVAFFSARFQRDVSKREISEATLRIRIEHTDAERRHLQGVYHDFLVLLAKHFAMMLGVAPVDEAKVDKWFQTYYDLDQGLRLFGAQRVRDALDPLARILDEVAAEAHRRDPSEPGVERLQLAFRKHREELSAAVVALREAMREDVAPELRLPKLGETLEGR